MSEIEVDKFRVTVLCEDKSHFHCVKGYLEALGFNRAKLMGKLPYQVEALENNMYESGFLEW
jgi:hypothetical protein